MREGVENAESQALEIQHGLADLNIGETTQYTDDMDSTIEDLAGRARGVADDLCRTRAEAQGETYESDGDKVVRLITEQRGKSTADLAGEYPTFNRDDFDQRTTPYDTDTDTQMTRLKSAMKMMVHMAELFDNTPAEELHGMDAFGAVNDAAQLIASANCHTRWAYDPRNDKPEFLCTEAANKRDNAQVRAYFGFIKAGEDPDTAWAKSKAGEQPPAPIDDNGGAE